MNDTTTLVIDVRTARIIFFTAAEPGTVAVDIRNLVATVPTTDMPNQMTLVNCYAYKLVSGKITSPPAKAPTKPLATVEQNNRNALTKALLRKLQSLWIAVPDWHPQEDHAKRSEIFYGLEQSLAERIAVSTTEPEFTGLAAEIEHLSV
jgi:hypothetical protein